MVRSRKLAIDDLLKLMSEAVSPKGSFDLNFNSVDQYWTVYLIPDNDEPNHKVQMGLGNSPRETLMNALHIDASPWTERPTLSVKGEYIYAISTVNPNISVHVASLDLGMRCRWSVWERKELGLHYVADIVATYRGGKRAALAELNKQLDEAYR